MNLEEALIRTMVEDLKMKSRSYPGYFLECVLNFLLYPSRQSLRCVSKFFYQTISSHYAGCFFFAMKTFNPSIYFTESSKFEFKEPFCGDIFVYDSEAKKCYSLATLEDFDRIEREIEIQIEGGTGNVKGCVVIKIMFVDGGQKFEKRYLVFPKKRVGVFTFYFAEKYSLLKEEPEIKKRKLLFYYGSVCQV